MSSLEEIKLRLSRISPLPWAVDRGLEATGVMTPEGPLTWDDHGGEVFKDNDALFIAQAPETISKLIDTLDAILELANETHVSMYDVHGIDCHEQHAACLASLIKEAIEEGLE